MMTLTKLKITSYSPTKKLFAVAATFSCTPLSSGKGIITLGYLRNWERLGAASSSNPDSVLSLSSTRRDRIVVSPVASSSSQVQQLGTEDDDDELLHQRNQKLVHVKLQLIRECQFGEQFLVVGDDPVLGLWDPSNAIPMNWSVGHLWTAELDVPIDKAVQFKFILRKVGGEILWQPGEDRTLQLWETQNMLSVLEHWDDEQARVVKEEEGEFAANVVTNHEITIVADDETKVVYEDCDGGTHLDPLVHTEEREVIASSSVGEENLNLNNGVNVASEVVHGGDVHIQPPNGVPVLVPGLLPSSTLISTSSNCEEKQLELFEGDLGSADTFSTNFAARESDGNWSAEEQEEGEVSKLLISTEHRLAFSNDSEQHYCSKPAEKVEEVVDENAAEKFIWENDIKWGRETLKKVLNSLGFQ